MFSRLFFDRPMSNSALERERRRRLMRRILLEMLWEQAEAEMRCPPVRPMPYPDLDDTMVKSELRRVLDL